MRKVEEKIYNYLNKVDESMFKEVFKDLFWQLKEAYKLLKDIEKLWNTVTKDPDTSISKGEEFVNKATTLIKKSGISDALKSEVIREVAKLVYNQYEDIKGIQDLLTKLWDMPGVKQYEKAAYDKQMKRSRK